MNKRIKKAVKKNIKKEVFTLIVYLVLFPLLGYISYLLYLNFILINVSISGILKYIIIGLIVGINIVALYAINYLINIIPRKYFIYNGIALNFILILMNIYYIFIEGEKCKLEDIVCPELMKNSQIMRTVLIISIAYTLIYLIMYSITNKGNNKHFFLKWELK